ncbi:hypothetical protein UPYG_G00033100 [Umbra pygmaea]|uniref:Sushi domain-containing protein n=1 Tax=Umbra pygmaea TaxID=75934 RepID=A0ABD0XN89_UMBPY
MKLYLTLLCLVNVGALNALSVCSGPLPNVLNAGITDESKKDEYKDGAIIYFACNFGHVPAGKISYVCEKAKWVIIRRGKCSPKPCELPDETAHGHYTIHDGEDFVFGASIKYTCNNGYQMVSQTDTRTCMLDGWSNHLPICEVVSCVPEATDGRVIVSGLPDDDTPIQFGHELKFNCPKPEHQLKGNPQVVCAAEGKWNNPFPTCEDVTCNVLEHSDVNVKGVPENNDTMKYGHRLQFECRDPKHILHGEAEVVCSKNGQWSHPFPLCNERKDFCGPPPTLLNGDTVGAKEQYRNGESVDYICQQFYTPKDLSHKTCVNGIWKGEVTCLKPCTVNEQLMAEQNIKFAWWTPDPNKIYCKHLDHVTFACTEGKRQTKDSVAFRQQCVDGIMHLPRCQ